MRAFIALVVILASALGYFAYRSSNEPPAPPSGFTQHSSPREIPDLRFITGELTAAALSDFRGRTVLLNLWATWCPPCVEEMPTLDALQAKLGGPSFEVVALSVDTGGADLIRTFYDEIGVRRLDLYVDPSAAAIDTLGAIGLPTTLLIDARGREIGRLSGPAEWDSPEMIAFLSGF